MYLWKGITRIATNIRNRSPSLELPEQMHSLVVELIVDVVEVVATVVVLVVVDAIVLEE